MASLTGCSRFIASPLDGAAEVLPQNVGALFGFCTIRGLERCLRGVLHIEQRHENGLLIEFLYGSLFGFWALWCRLTPIAALSDEALLFIDSLH